eukprot:976390-Amphidinium_carterae.1
MPPEVQQEAQRGDTKAAHASCTKCSREDLGSKSSFTLGWHLIVVRFSIQSQLPKCGSWAAGSIWRTSEKFFLHHMRGAQGHAKHALKCASDNRDNDDRSATTSVGIDTSFAVALAAWGTVLQEGIGVHRPRPQLADGPLHHADLAKGTHGCSSSA